MDPMETNDTLEDEFMYIVEQTIETGDCNQLRNVINIYKNKIHKNYIEIAENIYYQLVQEKFEDIRL
jgi:hypothetical protein